MKLKIKLSVLLIFIISFTVIFSSVSFADYNEAPVLAEQVKEGKLPSVSERLPLEPKVIEPYGEIGEYGGTLHLSFRRPDDETSIANLGGFELLLFRDKDYNLDSNIFKSFEFTDEGKVWTFELREGMKWSDGDSVTVDDIMFWWEDLTLYNPSSKDANNFVPSFLRVGNEDPVFEKIDDYTIQITFSEPYPLFAETLAIEGYPAQEMLEPSHYLKKFHPRYLNDVPDYGPEAEAQLEILDAELTHRLLNVNLPVLSAWKATEYQSGRRLVLERNPYYWKVDTEGNQLPYIDKQIFDVNTEPETVHLRLMAGDLDFNRRDVRMPHIPAFMSTIDNSDFVVYDQWFTAYGADPIMQFNQTYEGPEKELIRNKKFRQALSIAVDRDYINDMVWFGMGKSMQSGIPEGSPYYVEGLDQKYAQYDPDKANKMLDELGLEWDGKFRKAPWGGHISLIVDVRSPGFEHQVDTLELVKQFWEEVGVELIINPVERSLYLVRGGQNQLQIGSWTMDRGFTWILEPNWIIPIIKDQSAHGILYAKWYESNGTEGLKPEGDMLKMYELYEELKIATDVDQRMDLQQEILEIFAENVWTIGAVGLTPDPAVAHERIKNIPESIISDWHFRNERIAFPEQWFIQE